jgi:galactose mutarotase-like enzyme
MSGATITRAPAGDSVVLESELLRVTVHPQVGGTIAAIEHTGFGASILGTTPWQPEVAPLESGAAPDENVWLTRYGGGWPILFPNGGDACEFGGVFHGFHGEASIAPWQVQIDAGILRLTRRFATVPVEMRRALAVDRDLLTIRETVRMQGAQPTKVMWGHHPTFGSDLLDGPFEIQSGARHVTVDDRYDPDNNPLRPGAAGPWPSVPGKAGSFDLSHPGGPVAALACLQDFASPWASIRRLDGAIGAALSWDADVFPYAWLWYELGGTAEPPWRGRARLIGLEPNTTWPANGLADAAWRGGRLLTLQPGAEIATSVRLHVFEPTGPILGVDASGRAISDR